MKTYTPMDWRNYQPDIQLSQKVAEVMADEFSKMAGEKASKPVCSWNEQLRRYMASIILKTSKQGEFALLREVDGRYFFGSIYTMPAIRIIEMSFEEVDYGHYHRYTHFMKNADYVCENCPDDVSRDGKPFGAAL